MRPQDIAVSLKDLWRLVDDAFSLMNDELHRHHQSVSYLAYHMAQAAGLSEKQQFLTVQAAYMHDVGGILQGRRVTLTDVEEVSS